MSDGFTVGDEILIGEDNRSGQLLCEGQYTLSHLIVSHRLFQVEGDPYWHRWDNYSIHKKDK